MILIRNEDNDYYFIHYTQENIIFYSTHAIFNVKFFSECTDSDAKKYKLYNKLLDNTSLETELLALRLSGKDRSALVPVSPIQNNPSSQFSFLSLSYKSLSSLSFPVPK